ncbi:MAG: MFS transporter [Alphaproteobacteria bacterium]|nr:MFS transporter [Alphaproteobacteria bacterium]
MLVALGFLALALSFSVRAVLGLVMPVWQAELGWTRGFIAGGASTALVTMAAATPFAGAAVDRWGARPLLAGGLAAIAAASAAVAAMDGPLVFLLAFGVVAALGFAAVGTNVVGTAIAQAWTTGRGLATGIGTAGATAGQLALVPAAAVMVAAGAWRAAFAALAVGALALAVLSLLLVRDHRPASSRPSPRAGVAPSLPADLGFLLGRPAFHLLFWSFAFCGFTTTGVIETHLLPFAAFCGFPPLPSAAAYGILSAVNLAGMVAAGWLSDRIHRPALLGGIYVARALAFAVLLAMPPDIAWLYVFAVLFGLFDYSTVPVTISLVASHLGMRRLGLASGLVSAGHALGGAAGAFAGGRLFDLFAGYAEIWSASLALALLAGLLSFALRHTREVPESASRMGRRAACAVRTVMD